MSKTKRLKRKRAAQKKANIHQISLKNEMGPAKLSKRMARDHLDVLQNIEFALVSGYREDPTIDDRIVGDVLKAAIHGDVPEDARAQSLNESLEGIRDLRSDVSDDIWRDGLRTVLQSVHRHSNLRAGERDYLDFVSDFVV
ncbi:MAG: hypothetical protein H8E73_03620 [Planctomycetes bacterium]|nr:hypothetical protein [Planctomycetota bacterium]MBL7184684.1 hypothetical protein [Phycisphaerae bacterium]